MPCERINCAQCLTVLALKKDARGVKHFLSKIDKSNSFDPYVVIPSDELPTLVIERCLRAKDYGQGKAYLLADSAEPHLVFREAIMEHPIRQNGYEYHISTFYTIIHGCRGLNTHILSSLIGANLIRLRLTNKSGKGSYRVIVERAHMPFATWSLQAPSRRWCSSVIRRWLSGVWGRTSVPPSLPREGAPKSQLKNLQDLETFAFSIHQCINMSITFV